MNQSFRFKGQLGLLPKFQSLFGWIPKFAHLSHLPYQNVGIFFAQHLDSQNFGKPKFWYQTSRPIGPGFGQRAGMAQPAELQSEFFFSTNFSQSLSLKKIPIYLLNYELSLRFHLNTKTEYFGSSESRYQINDLLDQFFLVSFLFFFMFILDKSLRNYNKLQKIIKWKIYFFCTPHEQIYATYDMI